MAERQSAWISTIRNDALTRSGTGSFLSVPILQQWASKGYILHIVGNRAGTAAVVTVTDDRHQTMSTQHHCQCCHEEPTVTWSQANTALLPNTSAPSADLTNTWTLTVSTNHQCSHKYNPHTLRNKFHFVQRYHVNKIPVSQHYLPIAVPESHQQWKHLNSTPVYFKMVAKRLKQIQRNAWWQ